ncbi:MAG: UDP-N-acetylmuramate dehydrogenase [Endomicrobium sp.]|jgi:UDP-N-acetylmuramate dehydrogenase|nr:UDP-N-acetylmuramate dehydrogenase [Endomicrobium sp.]
MNEDIINELTLCGCKILRDEFLSKHCSFMIGGPADFFVEIPNEQALFIFLKNITTNYVVLGDGTNVLFSDKGYRGTVIRLTGDFNKIYVFKNEILSGSSALLLDVLQVSIKNNLVGLECTAGIPGTVGGAIYGNSGSRNMWISSVVKNVEIYNNSRKIIVERNKISFSYRKSGLEGCIITKVKFSLKRDIKNDSLGEVLRNIQKRIKTQPLNMPNAGSIFKNPVGFDVGKLIEEVGLKGKLIGGAQISMLHGNFIVNIGGASSVDVLILVDLIKKKVKEKFNMTLETEIKIIR